MGMAYCVEHKEHDMEFLWKEEKGKSNITGNVTFNQFIFGANLMDLEFEDENVMDCFKNQWEVLF